jgi:hypothetical protein
MSKSDKNRFMIMWHILNIQCVVFQGGIEYFGNSAHGQDSPLAVCLTVIPKVNN